MDNINGMNLVLEKLV